MSTDLPQPSHSLQSKRSEPMCDGRNRSLPCEDFTATIRVEDHLMTSSNPSSSELTTALQSLSNKRFLKWFFLVNAGIIIGLSWTGAIALLIPLLGFGGALISLVFAKWLALKAHGIAVIDPDKPGTDAAKQLLEMVTQLSERAGLQVVPEVGIYESPDMNAFATGSSPKSALVAFSSGLLDRMEPDQVRAVAAHEIAHIANQDMLGIVLLQGIVNSIVLAVTLPLRLLQLANGINRQPSAFYEVLLVITKTVATLALTFLGSLVVKAFSREREYRADAYAAVLLGKEPMIGALRALEGDAEDAPPGQLEYASFKISGRMSFSEIFSTHPPIEKRIGALEKETYCPR